MKKWPFAYHLTYTAFLSVISAYDWGVVAESLCSDCDKHLCGRAHLYYIHTHTHKSVKGLSWSHFFFLPQFGNFMDFNSQIANSSFFCFLVQNQNRMSIGGSVLFWWMVLNIQWYHWNFPIMSCLIGLRLKLSPSLFLWPCMTWKKRKR